MQPVLEKGRSHVKIKVVLGFSLALVCLANVAVKQVILTIIMNFFCGILQLTQNCVEYFLVMCEGAS